MDVMGNNPKNSADDRNFNREQYLKDQFNQFWNNIFSNSYDLYSRLTLNDFLQLKKILSSINNIITIKLTHSAAKFLLEENIISLGEYNKMIADINSMKPNANGYDIAEIFEKFNIIGEVKANIPCHARSRKFHRTEKVYGANQIANILKDINSLAQGKSKTKEALRTEDCLKFMFILDCDDSALDQIIKRADHPLNLYRKGEQKYITTNMIYIVPLEI